MTWSPLSLHFKQTYEGGHRYLDQCGEFMLKAEAAVDAMSEDAKPSGCKMVIPESGITVTVDTRELTATQEFQKDSGAEFSKICKTLVDLVKTVLSPSRVETNGFASRTFWGFKSSAEALAATLAMAKGRGNLDLAKAVDMPAVQESVNCSFEAGSMHLNVQVQPITFNSITRQEYASPPRSTKAQQRRVERLNKRARRFDSLLLHGVMMQLDLTESEPPEEPLSKLFDNLMQKEKRLQSVFKLT